MVTVAKGGESRDEKLWLTVRDESDVQWRPVRGKILDSRNE